MPPRGDNSSKGGVHYKQAAKIKKPSLQSQGNSKGRSNPRGGASANTRSGSRGNRSVTDEEDLNNDLNSTIDTTINNTQEEDSWLNHLPPVIKPDEELHLKLLKERKEKDNKKHFDICQSELRAMLNIALIEVELPTDDRDKFITKTRVDYFNGLYHDPITNTPRTPKSNRSNSASLPKLLNKNEYEINSKYSDFFQLKQSIQQLINFDSASCDDTVKAFNLQPSEASSSFDINPELNKIFTQAHQKMQPYIKQDDPIELLNFPFLICIVGPPCSGKSTICQFIATHFDVHIISIVNSDSMMNSKANLNSSIQSAPPPDANANSKVASKNNSNLNSTANSFVEKENNVDENINSLYSPFIICSSDDKIIINSIISEISDLPEKKGVVIMNYPDTKAQLAQLEKSLQLAAKKKGDGKFGTINGIIRASMAAEEAARQVQKRLIDRKTGLVFHPVFNPPDCSPNSKFNPEPYPYQISSNLNSTRNSTLSLKGISNSKNSKNTPNLNNIDKGIIGSTHPIMEAYTDLAPIYSKINPQLAAFDNVMKKIGPCVPIGYCTSIGQLNLLIESFLKAVYNSKNMEIPFTSFVVFENQDQFYYSKLCYNVFQIWTKECIPQFGKQINSLCNRLKQSRNQIDYLLDISMQMFSLIISKQDTRRAKTVEFIKLQNEIRDKIKRLQLIKEDKEAKKSVKQSSQSHGNSTEVVMIKPRASTCIASRAKTALSASPINQKKEKAIMTIRTRNLYLRNVFPNINIADLNNNRNLTLKSPDSLKFKPKENQSSNKSKNKNARPLTAISDIHRNLNLNTVFVSDLNKIDTDKEIEKEEKNLFELQINFYHFIWQQTIELRDRNMQIVDRFVRRSPIKAFKSVMEENEKIIFDALLKRFFLVDWFSTNLAPLLEKKENEEENQNVNAFNSSIKINNLNNSNNNSNLKINSINNSSSSKFQIQRPNYRQGSKLNLLSESALLEIEINSNVINKYNITEFPHPTIPKYDVTNLRELCSIMRIEYKFLEEEKSADDYNNILRTTKSNEIIITNNNKNSNSNSDELLSSDSSSFAYLMTPTNRISSMSKTPIISNNTWDLNPSNHVPAVASSCRVATNENQFDQSKKKLYFPPIISFEHSSSLPYFSSVSGVMSNRTTMSIHSIRSSSEKVDTNDDDSEVNLYSDSSYSYELNEKEEEDENTKDKKVVDQPLFPYHFPERRKCNRLNRNQLQNITNEGRIDSSCSSLSSIQDGMKAKSKAKPKIKIKIKDDLNDDSKSEIISKESATSKPPTQQHHHHHHHITKEDSIRNFLSYLQNETDDLILKPEAKVMQDIFVRFLNDKTLVDNQIDNELKVLRENLKKMIHQKCAKEMESFSRRFREYRDLVDSQIKLMKNQEQSIQQNEEKVPEFNFDIDNLTSDSLLPFDTSYMSERCIEIFNALDSNINLSSTFFDDDDDDNNDKDELIIKIIDIDKLQKLYSYYYNKCTLKMRNDNQSSNSTENSESAPDSEKKEDTSDTQKVDDSNKNNVCNGNDDDDDEIVDVPDCFVSLDDLCIVMNSLEFTEKEKLFIEANIRMKTIPEFINILYFIQSILPKGVKPCIDPNLDIINTVDNNAAFKSPTNSNSAIHEQIKVDDVSDNLFEKNKGNDEEKN